jgi:hypothetical protein
MNTKDKYKVAFVGTHHSLTGNQVNYILHKLGWCVQVVRSMDAEARVEVHVPLGTPRRLRDAIGRCEGVDLVHPSAEVTLAQPDLIWFDEAVCLVPRELPSVLSKIKSARIYHTAQANPWHAHKFKLAGPGVQSDKFKPNWKPKRQKNEN